MTVHDMTIHRTFLYLNVSKFNKNVTLPAIIGGMGPPGPGPIMPIGPGIGPDGVGMLDGGGIAAPPEDDFEAPGVKNTSVSVELTGYSMLQLLSCTMFLRNPHPGVKILIQGVRTYLASSLAK